MSKSRTVFYWQTFGKIKFVEDKSVTDIHLSSIHFGIETDGQPYIHLNNLYPEHADFTQVWQELSSAYDQGIDISLMIGGAGGGWSTLFSRYTECYDLLCSLLRRHRIITGIDLDIEENVDLTQVVRFIRDIKRDFPNFIISMSPLGDSLGSNSPGMGGFSYNDILKLNLVDYYCGQFYDVFTLDSFDTCIKNGYRPDQVLMGSMNGSGPASVVQQVKNKYPTVGGVCSWEYGSQSDPLTWSTTMYNILNPSSIQTEQIQIQNQYSIMKYLPCWRHFNNIYL